MYRAFFEYSDLSPLFTTLPAFFAKSSLMWPALLMNFLKNENKCKKLPRNNKLTTINKPSSVSILFHYFEIKFE